MTLFFVGLGLGFVVGFLTSVWFARHNKQHYDQLRDQMSRFAQHSSKEVRDEATNILNKVKNKF